MTPELKPCPFCGPKAKVYQYGAEVHCERCGVQAITVKNWNRRTPDLTEALARLKALEKEMQAPCVYESAGVDCSGCRPCGWLRSRAKEIAAIREAMGVSD